MVSQGRVVLRLPRLPGLQRPSTKCAGLDGLWFVVWQSARGERGPGENVANLSLPCLLEYRDAARVLGARPGLPMCGPRILITRGRGHALALSAHWVVWYLFRRTAWSTWHGLPPPARRRTDVLRARTWHGAGRGRGLPRPATRGGIARRIVALSFRATRATDGSV